MVYKRGGSGGGQVAVQATIGRTMLKLSDGLGGTRIEWTERDYIIATVDLVIAGDEIEPRGGDTIEEMVDTDPHVYEVTPYGSRIGDEPAWRWADPHHQMRRVHTKRIG